MSDLISEFPANDHDLLIRISVQLSRLMSDVESVRKTVGENQESRLRALENFRWWILGVASVLSFIGGGLAHFVLGK